MDKNLHLICNAHIDPVWLWDMEEGISAAISTFRMAANFCEEYDGFVFNHNEVVLYEWIEEQEPALFERIRRLVKAGKWHIMGGWYLQPDCNMPSGESFIRQMEMGRNYFQEKFGVTPTTAINFDPFGHSQGLVQLMAKAGFDSYLCCRPGQGDCPLPADDFIWVGFDGSKIMAHREGSYGTLMGEAGKKIREWLDKDGTKQEMLTGCVLWGVGNHGGGPSRLDLDEIGRLMAEENPDSGSKKGVWKPIHSTPEDYFADRRQKNEARSIEEPLVDRDLNSWAVGCYTSQIRIKQKHRQLEGELSLTEKMLSQAVSRGLLAYPEKELKEAQKILLFCEFHDILPGSSIQSVEEQSIRMLDQGLEIVGKWKRRAFFALLAGEPKAAEGEYPILIYNPHPYPVEGDFTCEFQLANQNWSEKYAMPVISSQGKILPSQVEKESCNMNLDWRKKVAFHAALKPASMNRFSANIQMQEMRPKNLPAMPGSSSDEEHFVFQTDSLLVKISKKTGLLDAYQVDNTEYVTPGACALVVLKTDCDPWGMNRHSYREEVGRFTLMDEAEGSWYSGVANERHAGVPAQIPSVRIIEKGVVRTVVEAVFSYGHSQACVRYIISARKKSIEMQVRVNWAEKGRFLKLEIPSCLKRAMPISETAYGAVKQQADGEEKVFQRWCGLWEAEKALTVINKGNYGVDFMDGRMRISMLHSAVYSAHPIGDRPLLVQDRFLPYIDQGEREFSFEIQGGDAKTRRENITQEAILFQEAPVAIPAFPSGDGRKADSVVTVDNNAVCLSAFRKPEGQDAYLIRLFESTGTAQKTWISFAEQGISMEISLNPYEVKTLRLDLQKKRLQECSILGRELS